MRPSSRRRGRSVAAILALSLLAGLASGCSSSTPPAGSPAGSASDRPSSPVATPATAGLSPEDAVLAYGQGPTRDPAITYQPDVVFIEGGPSIVRWASADGLTWAIDRDAPGASDLREGSVMFATTAALGRVTAIEDRGGDRIVSLVPVDLTDLVRDGTIEFDQDLDLADAAYHQLPDDAPAVLTDADTPPSPSPAADIGPGDGTEVVTMPPIRLAAARTGFPALDPTAGGKLTAPAKVCPKLGISDWSVEYCIQGRGLSLAIDRKLGDHLKVGIGLKLLTSKLRFHAGTVIKGGQMIDSGGLLDGLDGFELDLAGGVEDGAQDNVKVKIEVPVEIETGSIVVGGIPLKMYIEAKFTIETAFSGKNSTLSGTGEYQLSGPIGIEGGKPVVPQLKVVRSLLDSLKGITVGPSGVVIAVKWKFQGGVGLYGFVVGPYLTFTVAVGVGRGSVIGAALAECQGATLAMWVGAGGGFNLNASKLGWLLGKDSLVTKYLKAKIDIDLLQFQVVNKKAVTPDVPLCRG